jgi:hypothetical protein
MFAEILKNSDTFDGQAELMNEAALERLVKGISQGVRSKKKEH